MSETGPVGDIVPTTAYEEAGTTNEAAIQVRASEFSGLAGKLNPEEKVEACLLVGLALFVVASFTWRLLT